MGSRPPYYDPQCLSISIGVKMSATMPFGVVVFDLAVLIILMDEELSYIGDLTHVCF